LNQDVQRLNRNTKSGQHRIAGKHKERSGLLFERELISGMALRPWAFIYEMGMENRDRGAMPNPMEKHAQSDPLQQIER